MVSSSSSTVNHWIYDVFLNFRGEDTRKNFVSHLHKALCQRGIDTYRDDQTLEKGKSISPELYRAIKSSRFSIVILSKNYASSSWCLNELLEILRCVDANEQEVMPIFYNVDPSKVKKLEGTFAKAFAKHETKIKGDLMQRWKDALYRIATMSGWDSRDRDESSLVEEISNYILMKLDSSCPKDTKGMVGMESRMRKVIDLLYMPEPSTATDNSSGDIRFVGIWGMGGIGKTTLARAIYPRIARNFDACCFLEDVREMSKNSTKEYLQKHLLSRILPIERKYIDNLHSQDDFIKKRLHQLSVLIVLDDVDDIQQLELLAGGRDWFGEKSRIIITTRKRDVLKGIVDEIYEVNGLSFSKSMELFCQHAFKQPYPNMDLLEQSEKVIEYTEGNPLALKVLGSFLSEKSKNEWESALEKLKRIPDERIYKVLKLSFDDLDTDQKDIFLDIACFFKGKEKTHVIEVLDTCGFNTEADLKVLIDRCLVYTSLEKIWMHDLIQEMGQEVVRRQSEKDPGQRSRLMNHEDVEFVLKTNTGTNKVQAIALESAVMQSVLANPNSFAKMHSVRLLTFNKISFQGCRKGLCTLPMSLKYMHWTGYPYDHLPLNYHIKNLVVLHMPESRIKTLWTETKCPRNLKVVNLAFSLNLVGIPDLSQATNLEVLDLTGCGSLRKMHSSVGCLDKLRNLNLENCAQLRSLPNCIRWSSLKSLVLSGCRSLQKFPRISCKTYSSLELYLDGTAVEELPSSIDNLTGLILLNLKDCCKLKHLPNSLCSLKSLHTLILTGCSRVEKLPQDLQKLKLLETLEVGGTAITQMPFSIPSLEKVKRLSLNGCKDLIPWTLKLPSFPCLQNLTIMDLSNCNLVNITGSIGHLSSLRILDLSRNNFGTIPESIRQLPSLEYLYLAHCKNLKSVPQLPSSINQLDADSCTSLEKIQLSLAEFCPCVVKMEKPSCRTFMLTNCPKLGQHPGMNLLDKVLNFHVTMAKSREHLAKTLCLRPPRWCKYSLWFPGSEIPKWFSQWSQGCSLIMNAIPYRLINPFWALAVCVVVSLPDQRKSKVVKLKISCKGSSSTREVYKEEIEYWRLKGRCIGSDHLILGYTSTYYAGPLNSGKTIFAFNLYADDHPVEVKKCGLCLMGSRNEEDGVHTVIYEKPLDGCSYIEEVSSTSGTMDQNLLSESKESMFL